MSPFIFYEPFYSQIESLLNDRKAGRDLVASAAPVRSFKPR